ncbi:bifunctional alpha,alpha-trehalose-phosphate synthase (UDP-forming)/trehalose-phosphatase [Oxalobacter paraformigenes]|uniref:Alpha,alpha-trehalose-phosphate synthase (UDP-forming) n=1 Tax=Oxalobacter paraformigenes TaxID=556268 RepID=C3X1A1_9BURK|nr:bifunctional alpha,alpha-trehalose-phosphate synthase (UDP-forming)/trehalose-phosphatase [Oxalobacter paraformigenes]EEO26987.2 alpha,alpha-trehalose-phosphate synthase (UDP-forming) [Oxalobacter paraformigenes]
MKCVIVSNRLPVTVVEKDGKMEFARSSGGLATGLDSLKVPGEKHWLGWAGWQAVPAERRKIRARLKKLGLYPVFLTPEHIHNYYEGYSNSTLWPLCHYFLNYMSCNKDYWRSYCEVNELFCREAMKIIEPGDQVWIHDYQLMLLPGMIRARCPEVSIGYFHHIPFPSYEMFRYLPEREEILRGLLGADLIGFHVHNYMRHFISTVYRVLGMECRLDEVILDNRAVRIDAFPMGINYDLYHGVSDLPDVCEKADELRRLAGDSKIVLSVDRLDYSKGLLPRLEAYASFLKNHPEYREKVTMIMIVVPSRDKVDIYAGLKTRIDELVGAINGAHATVNWNPVHYFYRCFDFEELAAVYSIADIALVTPIRDGMNLVAKEYLAAKRDKPGVLILSEMAGAAADLDQAISVNPADRWQIEEALLKALKMTVKQQKNALAVMQQSLARKNVACWANDFMGELRQVTERNLEMNRKVVDEDGLKNILTDYREANRRLLVLDFDGTLVPLSKNHAQVKPGRKLMNILKCLAADSANTVEICSGRDAASLERWLGHLPIGLAAEHGAFFKEKGVWQRCYEETAWDAEILALLENITHKTPRSEIEIKKTALVWHYRQVDNWLAELRINQLINALMAPCARLGLSLMRGNKIIEIKPAAYNKGTEIRRLLEKNAYDFMLAIGDDTTDEDMFAALPPGAVTIQVGCFTDKTKYTLSGQKDVLPLLAALGKSGMYRKRDRSLFNPVFSRVSVRL